MFNEKRIEEIRKNIQISTILSDHEKSDWLNLLELMNDKQLGELEEILGVMPAVPMQNMASKPAASTPPTAPVKMPPLSHIANIPTDVTMTHSVPQSTPVATPQETVKPAAPVRPTNIPTTSPAKVSPPIQTSAPIQAPSPKIQPKPKAVPAPQQPAPVLKKLAIDHASDIQAFDVATLRQYELQSVVDAIRATIQANGYFQILQQLEASPLYRSYIETGKFMLGHGTATVADPETTLTQTEFEFITDLLRHMRFNTW